MIKKVLLIFKTHLDIGFTDYSANVIKSYLDAYIPKAIETAYEQRETNFPFVWTTGSWLIAEALEHDGSYKVEKAIKDGLIEWHALPFTTHSEYMNEELFRYGLGISKELDRRFNKTTIAAKMTDVPGHTKGIIPLLNEYGVEFLHIGVNPATPVPEVPKMFRWECGNSFINVAYSGDYGDVYEIGDTAVGFAMTGDNNGSQGGEPIKSIYDELRGRYPGAEITAGSINDFALLLRDKTLPVVTSEIGDSWIHGVGTDPVKTKLYLEVLRKEKTLSENGWRKNLMLIPEHTMGMDLKTFFNNEKDYTPAEIRKAENKETIEKSWQEQRNYALSAAEKAGINVKETLSCKAPDLSGFTHSDAEPDLKFIYHLFTKKDYNRYYEEYIRTDEWWSRWDFLKQGLPDYEGGLFEADVTGAWEKDREKVFRLEFPDNIREKYETPAGWLIQKGNQYELRMIGKGPNRLPEAYWIKFNNMDKHWKYQKLGQWIDPMDVIGNPWLHAVSAVKNSSVTIRPLDSMLAAPFGPHMLRWKDDSRNENLYFNLYNNIWNTNFPMWFSDDVSFRFVVDRTES